MKKVLYACGALLFLPLLVCLGLYLAGMREGAGHNGAAIEIDRPAELVWPYLSRFENVQKWSTGLEERQPADLPLAVGAKAKITATGRSEDAPLLFEQEVTAVEVNKRLAFTLRAGEESGRYAQRVEYRLDERGGRTRVSFLGHATFEGFFQLLEPLVTSRAQTRVESDLRQLKSLVERETAAPAPLPSAGEPAPQDATPPPEATHSPERDPWAAPPPEAAELPDVPEPADELPVAPAPGADAGG